MLGVDVGGTRSNSVMYVYVRVNVCTYANMYLCAYIHIQVYTCTVGGHIRNDTGMYTCI